jgi:hypothetical protein
VSAHTRRLNSANSARRSSGVPATRASLASSLLSGTTRAVIPARFGCIVTNLGYYDQIGRFMSDSILLYGEHAGVVDFMG